MKTLLKTSLALALALQALFIAWPDQGSAMMRNLSEAQKKEAILYGKMGVQTDVTEFIAEWSVNNGLKGFAFISTEFLALAYAARNSALRMAELNNFDIEDTLAKSSGKLVFRVTLFGDSPDFARPYTAVVQAGEKTIPTTFWDTLGGEPYGDGEKSPYYVADSDFFFPSEGIDPEEKITLIVLNEEEEEVARFPFDLGQLR